MSSFWQQFALTVIIAVITLSCLAVALTLQLTGNDASKAWESFGGFAVLFAGVHIPSPLSK